MKKQETGQKKQFHVYLEIRNYEKLLQLADEQEMTMGLALNELIRTHKSST